MYYPIRQYYLIHHGIIFTNKYGSPNDGPASAMLIERLCYYRVCYYRGPTVGISSDGKQLNVCSGYNITILFLPTGCTSPPTP